MRKQEVAVSLPEVLSKFVPETLRRITKSLSEKSPVKNRKENLWNKIQNIYDFGQFSVFMLILIYGFLFHFVGKI
jgi:hypothetical protein